MKSPLKTLLAALAALVLAGSLHAQKITALTANTTPADADLAVIVDDVAGTPTTQKITLANLKTYFQTGLEGDLSDSAGLAAAISDETGTGVVVFSTSPTLVTPVLGAATATDLTLTGQSIYMNSGQTVSIKAGTGSPEGAVTAGIGSLWLATDGTTNTTLWRKESGTGNTGWVAVSAAGGGDALVANPLSQFAATTSSQLAGVISDETGSGAAVFGTSPTIATPTITGANMLFSASAMGALAIDVTEMKNTKSISGAATMTFSATPSTGQIFGATVKNTAITDSVLTIPSSYSEAYNGARTTVTIPASGQVTLTWWYDGSQYNLYGDPVDFFDDIAEDLTPTDTNVDSVAYYDAATNAVKRIPIDDFIALNISSGNFGAAVFEIPNGTSGTTDATGEIYLDTDGDGGTNFSGPVVQIYDGSANKYLFPVALPLAASQDDYILKYDATGKTVQWEADATGAGGFDSTAVDATTWSDGANASNAWTFDVSGTDTVVTWGSAEMNVTGTITSNLGTAAGVIKIMEPSGSGTNYASFTVPALASNTTYTLPAGDGSAGDMLRSDGTGVLSWTQTLGTTATATTPSADDNDTSVATTAFVQTARLVAVNTKSGAYTIGTDSAAELLGGFITVTAAATMTGPATLVAGQSFTIKANTTGTVVFDPNIAHTITLDGTALAAGDSVSSTGTAGELITFIATSTTTLDASSDGWTDTN